MLSATGLAQTGILLMFAIPMLCLGVLVGSFLTAAVLTEVYRPIRMKNPNGEAWLDEGTVRFLLTALIFVLFCAWYLITHWNQTLAM